MGESKVEVEVDFTCWTCKKTIELKEAIFYHAPHFLHWYCMVAWVQAQKGKILMATGPEPIEHVEGRGWYFWIPGTTPRRGPYPTEAEAREALDEAIRRSCGSIHTVEAENGNGNGELDFDDDGAHWLGAEDEPDGSAS